MNKEEKQAIRETRDQLQQAVEFLQRQLLIKLVLHYEKVGTAVVRNLQ